MDSRIEKLAKVLLHYSLKLKKGQLLLVRGETSSLPLLKAINREAVDIGALAKDTPEPLKMQVYSMSLMPIRLDTRAEADYLDELARALGLNQQTVNALHLQMGVQPLYA